MNLRRRTQVDEEKERFIQELESLPVDAGMVLDALEFAQDAYDGRHHWSGYPLLLHTIARSRELLVFRPDVEVLAASILSHVLVEGVASPEEIEAQFSERTRSLLRDTHLLLSLIDSQRPLSQSRLQQLLDTQPERGAVLCFLSEIALLLERDASAYQPEVQRKLAREALESCSPLAARFGVYSLKSRIENVAFPLSYPTDALKISDQMAQLKAIHRPFLERVSSEMYALLKEQGIEGSVMVREKQPYSIFQKMHTKSINSITELYDLYALRVVVESEAECYQVLGLLHRIGHPMVHRFKDYIAFPKPNGYRSLHTTLARLPHVPDGLYLEAQVRTQQMHQEAEYGIAAHWQYKEDPASPKRPHWGEILSDTNDEKPVAGQMYVLTPRGDIVELPEGATPLDFAFQVHTDLGLAYRAARVNGQHVPMSTALENGDIVEILTHSTPKPSQRWQNLLKTASARQRLRRYLEKKMLLPTQSSSKPKAPTPRPTPQIVPTVVQRKQEDVHSPVPMPMQFARCCHPEQDGLGAIVGVVSKDHLLRVHRLQCTLLKYSNPSRHIPLSWKEGQKKGVSVSELQSNKE